MNLLGSALTSIKPRQDDTIVDRLNYYYSVVIIIVMAITLTAKQYVGQPIQCWVPAEFSKAWEQYAENYWFSFVYNTYWVRPGETVPRQIYERTNRQLIYYQWVPFLMALEAGFFYLPMIFWSQTNQKSGLNIASMVQTVERIDTTDFAQRKKAVITVCQHIEDVIQLRYFWREGSTKMDHYLKMGMLNGRYVSNMFIVTKIMYMINIVGQFVVMNQFLGQNNHAWGANILNDIISGRDWELSGNFPRIALCDFTVRTLSNVHRYSIQCVLVLNMFNEKIFLFLYWWLVLVGIMTCFDMIFWTAHTRISSCRVKYMKRFLRVPANDEYIFREFCDKIINADGTMLLRMISAHVNELFTQDILKILWDNYCEQVHLKQVVSDSTILLPQPPPQVVMNDYLSGCNREQCGWSGTSSQYDSDGGGCQRVSSNQRGNAATAQAKSPSNQKFQKQHSVSEFAGALTAHLRPLLSGEFNSRRRSSASVAIPI